MTQTSFFWFRMLSAWCLISMVPVVQCAGLTLDPCVHQKHCKGNRICRSARTLEVCKATSNYCVCVPINEEEARCDRASQCDVGESCFHPELWQESPACLSDAQIPSIAHPKRCDSDEDCVPNKVCAFVTLVEGYCAISLVGTENGNKGIIPSDLFPNEEKGSEIKPVSIGDMENIVNQSLLAEGSDVNASNGSFASNGTVAPSAEGTDAELFPSSEGTEYMEIENEQADLNEKACIAAEALEHLHPESLLYKTSFQATVLCDSYGSCATAGHIVYHNFRPMMMKSYCAKRFCVERVMAVNSVKYRRKMRIASLSPGLYYTAFSARYKTLAEEFVLAASVILGL